MLSRFRLPLRGLAQVFMTHDNALTIDGNDHKRSRPLGLPELISLFVERVEVFGCPDYQLLDLPFADLGSGRFPQQPNHLVEGVSRSGPGRPPSYLMRIEFLGQV